MSIMLSGRSRPLGSGSMYPAGSVLDIQLAAMFASYKRNVAGAYTSVSQVHRRNNPRWEHRSTKIDGEQVPAQG